MTSMDHPVFAYVRARATGKMDEQAKVLASSILAGISVGLAGSGAQVELIGPNSDLLFARALLYAKEFLDGMD